MRGFLLRRLFLALATLWLASSLVFAALLLLPGDPVQAILGLEASPAAREALERALGLDKPPWERYVDWLTRILRFDLGESIRYGKPVGELLGERLPLTLGLVLLGLGGALLLALPLALLALRFPLWDLALSGLMAFLQSVPTFFLGVVLLYALAVHLPLLPASGFPGFGEPCEALRHLLLPALTLALSRAAILFRMARGSLLEAMGQDYIRTARAKGVPEAWVLVKHALKPASLPLITLLGLEGGFLLTGAVVVEVVFALPGLGSLALTALEARDYPLLQGLVLVMAALIVLFNLLVDLLYGLLDPRVAYA
ncbi:ABC transporter permease [Thermus tengchongensis]|uniref:ABC transporter permease n=1 Tax=Thermus tengchongensis TaxID=1214928 RepID=A0ABY2K4N2_9DEIN|nr:ABC transporter permease [Thermus tengchongensis]TFU15327.1 ABC transporter permease [Thermus tengchongensis]